MCIGASAAVFLTYTLLVVVRTEPWYSPQYFIPILGEVLWATTCKCACSGLQSKVHLRKCIGGKSEVIQSAAEE